MVREPSSVVDSFSAVSPAQKQPAKVTTMPRDVWTLIFAFAPWGQFHAALSLTCRFLRHVSNAPGAWEERVVRLRAMDVRVWRNEVVGRAFPAPFAVKDECAVRNLRLALRCVLCARSTAAVGAACTLQSSCLVGCSVCHRCALYHKCQGPHVDVAPPTEVNPNGHDASLLPCRRLGQCRVAINVRCCAHRHIWLQPTTTTVPPLDPGRVLRPEVWSGFVTRTLAAFASGQL